MRKPEVLLKEYCQRLSEEHLRFLSAKLGQRLNGDVGDAIEFLSKNKELDKWFVSAESSDQFYDMIDLAYNAIVKECESRS